MNYIMLLYQIYYSKYDMDYIESTREAILLYFKSVCLNKLLEEEVYISSGYVMEGPRKRLLFIESTIWSEASIKGIVWPQWCILLKNGIHTVSFQANSVCQEGAQGEISTISLYLRI